MRFQLENITPTQASFLLQGNLDNRRLRRHWVNALAGRMTRGEWQKTHQGIAIDSSGRVNDGQHRLAAIVQSGKTIAMMVAYGVSSDTFGVVDDGMKRTLEDHTGEKNVIIGPSAYLARIAYGAAASAKQVGDIHAFAKKYAYVLNDACGTTRRVVTTNPVRAAAILQMAKGADVAYVTSIYRMVALSDTVNPSMPPVAHAFIRTLALRDSGEGRKERSGYGIFVRSLVLFDKSKRNLSRTVVKDPIAHIADARKAIISLAGGI